MRTSLVVIAGILMLGLVGMRAWGQEPASTDLNAQINGYERAAHSPFVGVPTDWSTSHVVFSAPEPGSEAEDQVQQDPRYWIQQIRRAQLQADDSITDESEAISLPDGKKKKNKKTKKVPIKKDWSESLGAAGAKVGAGFFPAKFTFGTSAASCSDYVAFNTSLAGSATQASIISFTNVYSGCGGTVPTIAWAFNTGGTVATSVTLSSNGAQLAFVQSVGTTANLVLLKWNAGPAANHALTLTLNSTTAIVATAGSFSAADVGAQITATGIPSGDTIAAVANSTHATLATAATATATGRAATVHAETAVLPGVAPTVTNGNYRACTAPCMTTIAFSGTPNDTNSSPYYVYGGTNADTIFVGDDTGDLHKFTGVFNGTPGEITTGGFPAQAAVVKISGPVYNDPSKTVFVVSSFDGATPGNGGRIHEVSASTGITPSAGNSNILGPWTSGEGGCNSPGTSGTGTPLTTDAPIVDPAAGTNGMVYVFMGNNGAGNAAVYQFAPGFAETSCGNMVTVGTGSTSGVPLYSGAFDALYFAAAPTGNIYVCGTTGGDAQLWRIPITVSSNTLGTPVAITTTLSTAATTCSQVTEFQNGAVDRAYVSVEASGRPANCGGTGCVMSFTITSALAAGATPSAVLPESGGTSGIVVDNASAFSGASQIYFSTLGGSTAIQAAQSGL
ncbi:hypothetical protein [Candidatus Binatus sp.]|uniref:hypothetical protein n=1 Tax=Candidatus Binatus sp. TaxID=2811406 RepID=UPI003C370BB1